MATNWKEALADEIEVDLGHEIDIFEGQLELRKQDQLDEKVFAETRLRRGAYGQRYDNGQRHDGVETRTLKYPQAVTKGPDTIWDAPGMQRIKVPFGGLTPDQLEVLAEVAEEYGDSILHVTTRQDFQIHYVHINDTPDLMRRIAAFGITTREACGNVVRNVTACPLAGVCTTESFDVTPYANALAKFLLGHSDTQDFGRKFKVAFSGCEHEACGLVKMHDLGLLARVRTVAGQTERGFTVYVGGGLGTVTYQAQVLSEFVAPEEIFPLAQAIARVFARLGEKRNRNRARIKFLVAKLGLEEFRRLVLEEKAQLPEDDWAGYLEPAIDTYNETPLKPANALNGHRQPDGFGEWRQTNVYSQRQSDYATVTVNLPLGDLSSDQARLLADVARRYVGDTLRTTVEQNIVLRWVCEADLPVLYEGLQAIGLSESGAGTIVDITTCPGTDTCKLGIASSRGLAGELRAQLTAKSATLPDAIKDLRIKISGCFNSCGQHHVADIGFFGNSRRAGNLKMPHFQVVLGGQWRENGGSYGLPVGAVPSKAVPEVLTALTDRFVQERERGETFQEWVTRLGKKEIRNLLTPFMKAPSYEQNPVYFSDWGDSREFTIADIGVGECAGEVVSLFSMEISQAESEAFEALIAHDEADYIGAEERAFHAMLLAARALVRTQFLDVGDDPDRIVSEFRERFYDTELFFDKYAKGKFAQYMFRRHEAPLSNSDAAAAHQRIEEAQLFMEATFACEARVNGVIVDGLQIA